jgi:protein SCO1/2
LPIYGEKDIIGADTNYYSIPNFIFYNQDSLEITLQSFDDKIYIADFFFTSCPTICPIMKKNMMKVQEKYLNDDRVLLLSHSIDTKHDNVERLNSYGAKMGIYSNKWYLVTGHKKDIYTAAKNYMIAAQEDKNAPGGYLHSGALVLVDKQKRIRGYYDGTVVSEVALLMEDIDILLMECFEKE